MKLLIELLGFLTPYGIYSYAVMFGILILCGFGLPMPEDIVLITGGVLSARGICDPWVTLAVCMAGVLLGDGVVFYLGRRIGPRIKASWLFRRVMNRATDRRVAAIFRKYGDKVVFIGRFMPGLRMPIFLSAGIYRLPPWKFFALDGFAAFISVPVWIYAGYLFGANLEVLEKKIGQLQVGFYAATGFLVVGFGLYLLVRRRKKNSAAASAGTASS